MGLFDFLKKKKTTKASKRKKPSKVAKIKKSNVTKTKPMGVRVKKTKTGSKFYFDDIEKKITKSQKTKVILRVKTKK
ncbi:MAG: hypothetical protein ABIF08_00065 [Nanoarchaeota archaeon]